MTDSVGTFEELMSQMADAAPVRVFIYSFDPTDVKVPEEDHVGSAQRHFHRMAFP